MDGYESFTEEQEKLLHHFVTSTTSNIFSLRNLPEVIKGALFSRYSRSTLGLRTLLLKEFIQNEETAFREIVGVQENDSQLLAIKKAQNFYDRILDGYGDDSIGELGGAHLAIEQISMLAAKAVEDCRIGGSPLEKSTRYIYFDQQVNGEYLFYREPILMTSAYRDLYVTTCNSLFETYKKLIPPLTELMEKKNPKEEEGSKAAYTAAIRAKVLDCLRGLLPAGTLTNMGMYGNGRFFEMLLQKMHASTLAELQDIGKKGYEELAKVIPSFVRRAEIGHRHQEAFQAYFEGVREEQKRLASQHTAKLTNHREGGVRLIDYTRDAPAKVAAAMLYTATDKGLAELQDHCKHLSEEELQRLLDIGCDCRENRRHKSPRALEHATFTFEIIADYGVYRDLHRHRMATQDRQLLTCNYGYYMPSELSEMGLDGEYHRAMGEAREAYEKIASELPEEAQYIVPMAYNIRWYFHINLRALQWLCELRSAPQGHPSYRAIAQEMARQVCEQIPAFEPFFKFVDYDGHELGRLGQEERKARKAQLAEG
ncbi:MAG: FAD-dependent thymidylate synthase [Parachlamydiales bacterium]